MTGAAGEHDATGRPGSPPRRRSRPARVLLAGIGFYSRAVSPALPPRCRFWPTCSAYAAEAVRVHGAGRGSWLAVRRLLKCAPWHPGGVDTVPAPRHRPPSPSDHTPAGGRADQQEAGVA